MPLRAYRCGVTATSRQSGCATGATSALLDFDLIKERAGELLGVTPEEVTDGALGSLFGLSRETIWHYRHGSMKPRFETVSDMADALGISVDDIRAKGNPTPPPKPGPSVPRPPAGPKPKAVA